MVSRSPAARARPIAPPDQQVVAGHVEPAHWDDPEHVHRTGTRTVRQVHGFRVADPLVKLHAHAPNDITRRHLEAARCLRDDHDLGQEVGSVDSLARLMTPRGPSVSAGPAVARLDALRRRRDAQTACGRLWDVVAAVVLAGWSVARWAEQAGKSAHAARERLAIGLDLLADYYGVAR